MMRMIAAAVAVVLAGPALADDAEVLRQRLAALETQLSDEEAARLAEAAAAEALRERLRNADAELTAMTLALEEQRRRAEETLTLLAAAQAAQSNLTERLAGALAARMAAREALARREEELEVLRAEQGNEAELRLQLAAALASRMQAEKAAETAMSEAEELRAQIKALGSQLNEALAYETGRFQMQVAGDGGRGYDAKSIEVWVLDTKTGVVRVCEGKGARAECSGWIGGHPDTEGMTDEEFLKHLGLE